LSIEQGLRAHIEAGSKLKEANICDLAAATQLMKAHPWSCQNLELKDILESNFYIYVPYLEEKLGASGSESNDEFDPNNSTDYDSDFEDDTDQPVALLSTSTKTIKKVAKQLQVKANMYNFKNKNNIFYLY